MAKSAVGLPPPPKSLDATLVIWGGGLKFHRVHDLAFGGSEFNTGTKGNARFSPITDDANIIIPTLYSGTTLDCALMETILHDVPFKVGFKPFSRLKMDGKVHSVLRPTADLRLIDLGTGWDGLSHSLLFDGDVQPSVIDLAARTGVTLVN